MSRRRAYSDSDDEDSAVRRKRRRVADQVDIEDRLESLIIRVGEKSTSALESNLEGLANVLEADLSNFKMKIIRILMECVVKLPEKVTVYSTLCGLLNAKNYNCGGEIVEMLVRNLKEALKTGELDNARMMIRFLADLVNCHVIVAGSLLAMFDSLVEVTLEDNIPQVRSDYYVYCVLSALPWVGRELFEKKETEFSRLLMTIENYLSKRHKNHVAILRVWQSDDPHPQEDYLDCLWAQIKSLRNSRWMEKTIVRPYLAFDGVLCEALQHTLPHIIPPSYNEDHVYPFPRVVFRMFDYTDVPEGPILPGSHAIERYLIEEQLHRIIHSYHEERKDCAAILLSYPTRNLIPLNYMIVEALFSQLFELPRAPHVEIFYGSVLIELCRLQPGSMPLVLAQATEMLFQRLDTMNTCCIERFIAWLSYHLSNFQFKWSWEDWVEDMGSDLEMPKPKFVAELLQKMMRLSYHQRMKEMMPESMQCLVPTPIKAINKYESENASSLPGTMASHNLAALIKQRCSPDEATQLLKDLPNPMDDDDDSPSINPLKVDVFVTTLFNIASKSFSHMFAAIAKFHDIFRAFGETEEGQMYILKAMYEVFRNHQQMMVVIVDKMLKVQIVECSTVANWLFSQEMTQDFTRFYVWEIMHATIGKMNKHVTKLRRELDDHKDKLEAAQRKLKDGFAEELIKEDVPTEEQIERMEEKLDAALGEQKNLFLIVFQRFIIVMTEHIARCEADGKDVNTPWFKWVRERLQQTFLVHHEQVYQYVHTLENLLFTNDTEPHILEIYQQFCYLKT